MRNPFINGLLLVVFLFLGQKFGFGNVVSGFTTMVSLAFFAIAALLAYRVFSFIYLNFKGTLARRDEDTFEYTNQTIAEMICEGVSEELMRKHGRLDMRLSPALVTDDAGGWRTYYLELNSPEIDLYHDLTGKTHGFALRIHDGWKKYYTIATLRGKGDNLKKLESMNDGSVSKGINFIVTRAKNLNEEIADLNNHLRKAS